MRMATTTLLKLYSFRAYSSVLTQVQDIAPSDVALVSSVEAALLEASQDYAARNYQAAIDAYLKAQALIYAQLDSSCVLGEVQRIPGLPRDPSLFDPMLSAALEWMNVLPVPGPVSPVRPQLAVSPTTLSAVTTVDTAGLMSPQLSSPNGMQAAADLHLAATLTSLGNTSAAQFYQNRANQVDSAVVAVLAPPKAPAAPVAAAPVAAAPVTIKPSAIAVPTAVTAAVPTSPIVAKPILISPVVLLPTPATVTRSLGILVDGKVSTITWAAGASPALDAVKAAAYTPRTSAATLEDAISSPTIASDLVLALPHNYFYVIALGLAECYHGLGDWANAEKFYLQAAAYTYLNTSLEAPYVWTQLAALYLDWGNALYMSGDVTDALTAYEHVLNADGSVPAASSLYTTTGLAPAATAARSVVTNLAGLVSNPASASTLSLDPQLCSVILEVHQRLVQIAAGLDFWGHWAARVPIWTFDYLQQVAVNFAQLAISAEQQVISYWDRADQGQLTQLQLTQQVSQANAEVAAAQAQTQAAQAQQQVYQLGLTLAQQRATDATANATQYASTSAAAIVHQALQTQLSGGDDGDAAQLNSYADIMMSGNYDLSDSRATLAAAEQLTASRLSQQYEVAALQRTAAELQTAQAQAQAEVTAANAQVTSAQAAQAVASLKAQQATAMVSAFNAQTFTPDVWKAMGDEMMRMYQRYFAMALRTAKLMQQAYNFETDQQLSLIKSSYASDEIRGLLGADALMADIQGFTYDLITSTRGKVQPIKHTISLAEQYGWDFETQFRQTGSMTFETRIDDFDNYYPGTYAARIKSVEVNAVGLVPVTGLSGTLTCSGLSWYRLPSDSWATTEATGLKTRVQSSETLVLSDYSPATDALLYTPDTRMGAIFSGAGVVSSWQLDVPKEINDIDYGALLDVTITFLYEARFDPQLAARVQTQLASNPGTASLQRGIPIRWVYPDLFFNFIQTGELTLSLAASDFPVNQTKPQLTSVGLQVSTSAPLAASGITFSLATPGNTTAAKAASDANGAINSLTAGSTWAPLATGSALGAYTLSVTAADNPALASKGTLDLSGVQNVALVLTYTYTPR
jgi:hypothetical protein